MFSSVFLLLHNFFPQNLEICNLLNNLFLQKKKKKGEMQGGNQLKIYKSNWKSNCNCNATTFQAK